jgi:hypothetical protein
MDRSSSAGTSLRFLDDDELGAVSGGGGHGRRRRRGGDHHEHDDGCGSSDGGFGGLSWLLNLLSQSNFASIIQIVTGNTGPVSLVAGVSQSNVSNVAT